MSKLLSNQEKLSDGVGRNITRAIYTAIDNSQKETLQDLVNFVSDILFKTIKNNLKTFDQFTSIPSYFYFKGYITKKFPHLVSDASQILTDLIRISQVILEKSTSISDIENLNHFIYLTYRGYSQLFYQILVNKDLRSFEIAIDKYRTAFLLDSLGTPSFIRRGNLSFDQFEKKFRKEIEEYRKLSDYHRRIKFAVLSWLYFLYDNKQLIKSDLMSYINLISFDKLTSNDLINDLIFYNSFSLDLFDWHRWDYIERKEFIVYTPPEPSDWLTFGFALMSLKHFDLSDINYETFENIQLFKWLPVKLKGCFNKILNEKEKWADILWPEQELYSDLKLLENKTTKILDPFYRLKRKYERSIDQIILKQDLSEAKINSFRQAVYEVFNRTSSVREAFISFKNIQLVNKLDNPDKDIFGINTNLTRAKMMFVEEKNQFIFGTENWGGIIARNIDEKFITRVENIKTVGIEDNVSKSISKIVDNLRQKEYNPSLIFIDSHLTYSSFGLTRDSEFVPSWNSTSKEKSIFEIGYYKGILVKSVFGDAWRNKVMICDFNKSFKAQELNNENWLNKVLNIQVESISDEQANEIYSENPLYWQSNEEGIELSKIEAIEIIKLNVLIKIYYEILFEFLDKEAFEIIIIK